MNETSKKLRVWWIPQVPMKSFHVEVDSPEEARKLLRVLANYDLFQFENNIKPDYCNVGGLQEWDPEDEEEDKWCEWCDEDGYGIGEENPYTKQS